MDTSPQEYQPCPLQFYEFQQLDSSLHCPIYSDILDRPGHPVKTDSIDALQSELIALHDSVKNRINLLESEVMVLDNWQVKRDYRKRKHSDSGDSRGQRSDTPYKKQKIEEKHKKLKSKKSHDLLAQQSEMSGPATTRKGDAPDRFWASVEPYCADITENDLKMLQEESTALEADDVFTIPPLGTHYSRKWASDDIFQEKEISARLGQLADPFSERGTESEQWSTESDQMINHANLTKSKAIYGPLTERLISAFMEDSCTHGITKTRLPPVSITPGSVTMTILENRLKQELTSLGLFDSEEDLSGLDEEDEILEEIKKKQDELRYVSDYNRSQKQTLHSLAKQEVKRQETRQLIKEADDEVLGWQNRIVAIKQKRKGILGRKEKEAAWRALQHREDILRRITHKLN